MEKGKKYYSVSLSFESISLPPFEDILILGSKCPLGKFGISKCLDLLSPDEFEFFEFDDETIGCILLNKRILKRMPKEEIVQILKKNVFPYIESGEIVKVNFPVKVTIKDIEGSLER